MSSLEILYEDNDIMVVNKPSGLMVHGDGKSKEATLADWILEKYPETTNVGEPWVSPSGEAIPRPGIVHRLDRDTSGIMLIAKTQKGFDVLKKQFQDRTIEKEYHAIVYGEMKDDRGTIDRPIGRSSSDFRRFSAQRGARGMMREARTDYKVVGRSKGFSFVKVFPKTGRTHQIRVHMKAINHPLVGDQLYAPGRESVSGIDRTALHAARIGFHDTAGVFHSVSAPYPPDFLAAMRTVDFSAAIL